MAEDKTEERSMTGQKEHRESRIVVGVDGSPSSLTALRWAVRQAALTGAAVDAVIAWQYPVNYGPYGAYGWAPVSVDESGTDFDEIAYKTLADAVAKAVDPHSAVIVRQRVIQGNPAQALLDAANGAELLVVGSRGHGGFTGALLGSVGLHCVHHAHCPVVVIRGQVRG
jgi:nucleotide-binding universal stress UspA family protein